ncbi:MAG: methionine aminotransferase [Bacteroidota bacterium]
MIHSKLPNTGTTIFSIMTQLANEHKAINLSQGFPEFQAFPELGRLVKQYIDAGFNQYAPMHGVKELREQICSKIQKHYKKAYNPDTEIVITSGATQALYTAITAFIHKGDEVIIFEPAYDSYVPVIELNGGIPVFIKLNAPNFSVNWTEVRAAITEKTKMIIVNNPHNPTGVVFSKEDLSILSKIVSNTDIIIISDEVYEHITFDGIQHISASSIPELAERTIVITSFGKTFHTTGWKVGYCVAPEELIKEIKKVHQYLVFSVNTPVQYALAEFLKDESSFLGLSTFYEEKRNYFAKLIGETRFKLIQNQGTFFQLVDISTITDEDDYSFAIRMTKEYGVASIPLSVFYSQKEKMSLIRFCFAKHNETLERGVERLIKL